MRARPIPVLKTKRLILRGITLADAPSYGRHFIDYEVVRTLANTVPWPYPEDGIENFITDVLLPGQGKDFWAWGLFLTTSPNKLIGGLTLRRDGPKGNRGFWLGRQFWGQGLMSEAVDVTLDFAFNVAGFEVLHFQNAQGNEASRRIKQATGARYVGEDAGHYLDPALTITELWELRKQDWLSHKS
ncbi:MAG TPA: N-acetyltransferase [Hellea balneolensis]|uniref:N-acetyltransferase n=1 Tax=Hellea balneolensis TaxID=287478 RepID=A0A7C3C8M5_9PROT|nr:N-acetyltransferase [Hellea balneolensis]